MGKSEYLFVHSYVNTIFIVLNVLVNIRIYGIDCSLSITFNNSGQLVYY